VSDLQFLEISTLWLMSILSLREIGLV